MCFVVQCCSVLNSALTSEESCVNMSQLPGTQETLTGTVAQVNISVVFSSSQQAEDCACQQPSCQRLSFLPTCNLSGSCLDKLDSSSKLD